MWENEDSRVPVTIEELKDLCVQRGINLYRLGFYLGSDHIGPNAYGVYKDYWTGDFIVYKNIEDGSKEVLYQGQDEATAVSKINEQLQKVLVNAGAENIGTEDIATENIGTEDIGSEHIWAEDIAGISGVVDSSYVGEENQSPYRNNVYSEDYNLNSHGDSESSDENHVNSYGDSGSSDAYNNAETFKKADTYTHTNDNTNTYTSTNTNANTSYYRGYDQNLQSLIKNIDPDVELLTADHSETYDLTEIAERYDDSTEAGSDGSIDDLFSSLDDEELEYPDNNEDYIDNKLGKQIYLFIVVALAAVLFLIFLMAGADSAAKSKRNDRNYYNYEYNTNSHKTYNNSWRW